MKRTLRWVEISTACERERQTAVSELLQDAGIENEVSFIETTPDSFAETVSKAQREFDQIRVGGLLTEMAPFLSSRVPSQLLTLRSADALVKENGEWWPRNFLVEGVQRAIAGDLRDLDFQAGVFILGATPETRALVSALVRVGFSRFNISDSDESRGQEFLDQLRSAYFNIQFQFISRHMITQLPGVHSVAINTIQQGKDAGSLAELFYFNFLKAGGIWLDLPLMPINTTLEAEARSIGAVLEPGYRVWARADHAWMEAGLGARLDLDTVLARYERLSYGGSEG